MEYYFTFILLGCCTHTLLQLQAIDITCVQHFFCHHDIDAKYPLALLMTNFHWGIWLITFSEVYPLCHIFPFIRFESETLFTGIECRTTRTNNLLVCAEHIKKIISYNAFKNFTGFHWSHNLLHNFHFLHKSHLLYYENNISNSFIRRKIT